MQNNDHKVMPVTENKKQISTRLNTEHIVYTNMVLVLGQLRRDKR
jgi:hypothetical protein